MSSATSTDPGLRPWQLFVLAGMLAATGVVLVSNGQTLPAIVVLSITVVLASLVAVAGYRSLAPLVVAPEAVAERPAGGRARARAALEREKALVLRTIKEVEFDHAMGKTATADFEEMRDRLRVRAVGLIRQLDGDDVRGLVERDVAARVAASVAPRPTPSAPVSVAAEPDGRCRACHTANDVDARFCKQCGAALAELDA